MTKYVRHFLEDPLDGTAPPNISAVLSVAPDNIPTLGQSASMFLGDRVLGFGVAAPAFSSPSFRNRGGVMMTDLVSAALTDIIAGWDMGTASSGVKAKLCIGMRVAGSSFNYSGYFLDIDDNSDRIVIKKAATGGTASTETELGNAPFVYSGTSAAGVVVHARFQCFTSGATVILRAKAWLNQTAEPSAWMIDTVDAAAIIAAGSNFVGAYRDVGGVSSGPQTICYICVATNNDTPPARPKSWQEYLTFLDTSDALRCMLVEQNVLADFGSPSTAQNGILCLSNYPFVSAPEDRYPNVCYEEILTKAPQMRRKLTAGGIMQISYGDLTFKNETTNSDAAILGESFSGRLDNWLAYNVDGRTTRILYGSPQWRRCDFKPYFVGVSTGIYRAGPGELALKLRGQEVMFTMALSTEKIGGTGLNKDALAPISLPPYFNVEPILYDSATLRYRLESTQLDSWSGCIADGGGTGRVLYDGGVSLNALSRYFSANVGTAVLNTSSAHNLQVGMEVQFDTNFGTWTLPTGLVEGVTYYVSRVTGPAAFALTATPGSPTGAEIIYVDTPAPGAFINGRPYSYSSGILMMLNQPVGRLTAYRPLTTFEVAPINTAIAQVLTYAFSNTARGSKPVQSFRSSYTGPSVGGWWDAQRSLGEAITQVIGSTSVSFCFSRFGTYYLYQLGIPTGTAVWNIVADDIRNWKTGDRNLPRHVERLGYKSNFTIMKGGDLFGAVVLNDRDLYGKPYSLASYTPSESGLSQPDNHQLVEDPKERETMLAVSTEAVTEVTRLYNLYRKPTGTYVFDTDAWALAMELGDEVSIAYPKDGFAAGKNAIIVGITEDAMRGVVTLEVFCQIDELFPIISSTSQPQVSEAYY